MSIAIGELLELAKEELGTHSEVRLRSAISRAYYFAYHSADHIATECPAPDLRSPRMVGMHKRLVERFKQIPRKGQQGGTKLREIGITLGKALESRKMADYMLNSDVVQRDLKQEIFYAERIDTLIREYHELKAKWG